MILSAQHWRTNGELLAGVASLGYFDPDVDSILDVTYGRGLWWTEARPARLTTHDIAIDGVDFRALPEADGSFDVVAFDPPYVTARPSQHVALSGRFRERYLHGGATNRHELVDLVTAGLGEAARVVRRGGVVLVKCQPFQNGKRDFLHMPSIVAAHAESIGLRIEDEFILLRPPGPAKTTTFHHARSAHSVLFVFKRRPSNRRRA
jgi:methylase of polypeptide subunit release factors